MNILRLANIALLIALPLSWFTLFLRAGLLHLFGLNVISIIAG